MKDLVFALTCTTLVISNVTLWLSIVRPDRRFWPPPEPGSSTYRLARVLGSLGPLGVLGSFALGLLDWSSLSLPLLVRVLGALLFITGGGFALWGYLGLGIRASQGRYEGLVARGAYRFSRNPQYVGTIACVLGHALLCASGLTLVVWSLWTLWFLAAPLAEEPWMRSRLGPAYDEYAARVPRFLGWPPREKSR
jgi:protein-S-isoprenylcysteine O-methyltransferase Ste14